MMLASCGRFSNLVGVVEVGGIPGDVLRYVSDDCVLLFPVSRIDLHHLHDSHRVASIAERHTEQAL